MEKNLKEKKKVDKKVIIFMVCIMAIGCFVGIATVSYNYFFDNNKKAIETLATNEKKEESEVKNETSETKVDVVDSYEEEEPEVVEISEEQIEEAEEQDQEEIIEISEEEKKKQEEEEKKQEEEQRKKREEEEKRRAASYPYYLKVNYTANTVTAYGKDDEGNYTVPVRAMICSSGAATPTSGVYKTQNKYRWKLLIGNSYGQYSTRITGQILFHSVPYETQSPDSIITKYYDRLGITTSLGCIRLTVADAKWIYDNCPLGTSVEFYSSSNPGPLGKPSAMKITGAESPLDRWDPTDPDPNNPWRNQPVEPAEEENVAEEGNNQDKLEEQNTEVSNDNQNIESDESNQDQSLQENTITVPNVVGKSENEAITILNDLQLTVENIEYKTVANDQNGIVIEQSLMPGALVEKQSKIKIVVGKVEENINENVNETNTQEENNVSENNTNESSAEANSTNQNNTSENNMNEKNEEEPIQDNDVKEENNSSTEIIQN